jgi:hypothetical protein
MTTMPFDNYPFRPHQEPARSIHDAFQLEASKRKERALEVWIEAELQAVFAAARLAAERHGLRMLSLDEIKSAERYARGSADYGSKWAYTVVDSMRRPVAKSAA